MAIGFRAAATGYQNAGTTVSATLPASAQVGDVVLACMALSESTVGDPSISGGGGGGTWVQVDGTVDDNTLRTKVWRRTVVSGDPGATITASWGATSAKSGLILLVYSGVDTMAPINASATAIETGTSGTHNTPGVTPTVADCWVVEYVAQRSSACSTITAPAGRTERAEQLGNGGGTVAQIAADSAAAVTQGVSSGSQSYTFDISTGNAVGWSIALTPASTGTPVNDSDTGTLTEADAALTASTPATDTATTTETPTIQATTTDSDAATITDDATRVVIGEPTYRFAIDWNDDGDFTGPGEDVTDRVLARGGFTAAYGRDQARALAPPAAGRATFTLDNTTGDYSPDNQGSPLAGDLLPARQIEASVELNGERHVLFRGHLDDYDVKVERNSYTVDATALDPLATLRGATVSTPLYQGIRTGTAIHRLLDAVGWPADKRTIDPGATLIRWWWAHEEDAWDALMKLVGSEGPGAIVHADENGGIVFRDRHHRLLDPRSTTGQAVITDGIDGFEPAFSAISYDHGWKDIVNSVSFSVEERDPATHWEEIWTSDEVYPIAPNDTWTLDIQTSDPIRPGPGAIWLTYAYGGTVTHTVTQNSARSITLTFTAGPSGARLSDLKVHGQTVATRRTYQVEVEDEASIAKYGRRSPTSSIDAPWAGVHDALAIANLIIGARAERLPTVKITIKGARINDRLVEQLGRDLSDRIHVTESVTGVDADFYLEQISHRVLPGGFLETEFGLEKAAVQVENAFRFDDPDHGFDDGVFATDGLDDPANLFIFDQAGHGFDDGVFAT